MSLLLDPADSALSPVPAANDPADAAARPAGDAATGAASVPEAAPAADLPRRSPHWVRERLIAGLEVALLDLREEDPHAQAHPLFAANLPFARIELDAWNKLPNRAAPIVLFDDGAGLAARAAATFARLGYADVALLDGDLDGWRAAGYELFRDVNAPSKAFGELVEAELHTPSLAAEEVQALIDAKADVVIVDARRFDEFRTMSIPTATSLPGAELVARVRELAPDPATRVIVNCAGRTRSIIGTQSLVNAGLPNPVSALRNGTIGWTLAGQQLDTGRLRRAPLDIDGEAPAAQPRGAADGPATATPPAHTAHAVSPEARAAARAVADRAGVRRASLADLDRWLAEPGRTTYRFDVRLPEAYEAGHLPGFRNVQGGQLVQETEMHAPVRGARLVLADPQSARADMTASWLAQMNWEVHVLDGVPAEAFSEHGPGDNFAAPVAPPLAADASITPAILADWLAGDAGTRVIDFTTSANHVARHIPGAWWALRSQLAQALATIPAGTRYVLTCGSSALARHVVAEVKARVDQPVFLLEGGNAAWFAAGLPAESGDARLASPRIDRYRRPYEGTDNPREAMQGYLDWEFGLVEQLGRDGTHGFRPLRVRD
ncbi:rhodanese homology domain-containing protein [Derxia gummosa]|uniref:Rhodanese homology domain-containing protein n=1 Tax=Derxia gummosa DSM 723 TaxID=1121388 RepID=A0A8B6XB51_9BURK|nr:rhodanese homology domain-containing protein [Derxia gummosa]